jgi:hypothetical protein
MRGLRNPLVSRSWARGNPCALHTLLERGAWPKLPRPLIQSEGVARGRTGTAFAPHGGEVAALAQDDRTRCDRSSLAVIKPLQHGPRLRLPEMVQGCLGPCLSQACRRLGRLWRPSRCVRWGCESASHSAVVSPWRWPLSTSTWATHRCTVLSDKPISRQICATSLAELRIIPTVSTLNSRVNWRLEGLSGGLHRGKYPRLQGSAKAGQLQLVSRCAYVVP